MDSNKIVCLITSSIIEVEGIQGYLEDNSIATSIRDEFSEGLHAGFPGGVPNQVSLMVLESQFSKAKSLMNLYQKSEQV